MSAPCALAVAVAVLAGCRADAPPDPDHGEFFVEGSQAASDRADLALSIEP